MNVLRIELSPPAYLADNAAFHPVSNVVRGTVRLGCVNIPLSTHEGSREVTNSLPLPDAMRSGSSAAEAVPSRQPVELTEHSYDIYDNYGKPWATLTIKSRARSPTLLPAYYEGDSITGTFHVHQARSDPVKAVILKATGRLTNTRTGGEDIFVQLKHTVWSASGESTAKLKGSYSWPFYVDLPREVRVNGAAYPLPPTFHDRDVQCTVQYDISVHLKRGRLRMDSKFGTAIGFVPYRRPPASSALRQVSYLEGLPLVGPDEDDEGWTSLQPARISGMIFKIRPVQGICELWVANPTCYTRRSAIPCFLNIRTDDRHVLDLLSSPKAPNVQLVRTVGFQATNRGERDIQASASRTMIDATSTSVVATAVWWPTSGHNNPSQNERRLEGEIHLPPDLPPSCIFPGFMLSYTIEMRSFEATGYSTTSHSTESLASLRVEVVTAHPTGPRARRYASPSYRPATPPRSFSMDMAVRGGRTC